VSCVYNNNCNYTVSTSFPLGLEHLRWSARISYILFEDRNQDCLQIRITTWMVLIHWSYSITFGCSVSDCVERYHWKNC